MARDSIPKGNDLQPASLLQPFENASIRFRDNVDEHCKDASSASAISANVPGSIARLCEGLG